MKSSLYTKNHKNTRERKIEEERDGDTQCIQEPEDSTLVRWQPSKILMQSFGRNWKTSFYFMCKYKQSRLTKTNHNKLKARYFTEELRGILWLSVRTHKTILFMSVGPYGQVVSTIELPPTHTWLTDLTKEQVKLSGETVLSTKSVSTIDYPHRKAWTSIHIVHHIHIKQ